jgi:hypothetical protein
MWHAVCEVCRESIFDPREALAYRLRGHKHPERDRVVLKPEGIALGSKPPWSGVRVICLPCKDWVATSPVDRAEITQIPS